MGYKLGDDQRPYLTALITYYGFLSLFPLLLLLVTVLGLVLQGDSDLQARLVNSTLAELPIIGSQLRENVQKRVSHCLLERDDYTAGPGAARFPVAPPPLS